MENVINTDDVPKDYFTSPNFDKKYTGKTLADGDSIYIKVDQEMLKKWLGNKEKK
jgi:hypothetical protein